MYEDSRVLELALNLPPRSDIREYGGEFAIIQLFTFCGHVFHGTLLYDGNMKCLRHIFPMITAFVILLSVLISPSRSFANSDCPQNWQILSPKLEMTWNASSQTVTTNLGLIGSPGNQAVPIDFGSSNNSGLQQHIADQYGKEFASKVITNTTKVSFRSSLIYGSPSSSLKDLNTATVRGQTLLSLWQSNSRAFSSFDPKSLLSQGVTNDSVLYHLLEVQVLGCSESRFIVSSPFSLRGIPTSLLGFDNQLGLPSWKTGVSDYLSYMVNNKPTNSIRSFNIFNWNVNLEKFEFLVNKLKTLDKDTSLTIDDGQEEPFDARNIVKFDENSVCGGEDCDSMVPTLVGYSPAGCLKDLKVFATPCKVALIGPDGSKADKTARSIWAIHDFRIKTVVGVFEIPKRRLENAYYERIGLKFARDLMGGDLTNKDLKTLLNEIENMAVSAKVYDWPYGKDYLLAAAERPLKERLDLLAKQRAEAEARAKAEAAAKAATEAATKASAEIAAKAKAEAEAKAKASSQKSITCVKGKSSLKVIGKNPKCPKGYKKR